MERHSCPQSYHRSMEEEGWRNPIRTPPNRQRRRPTSPRLRLEPNSRSATRASTAETKAYSLLAHWCGSKIDQPILNGCGCVHTHPNSDAGTCAPSASAGQRSANDRQYAHVHVTNIRLGQQADVVQIELLVSCPHGNVSEPSNADSLADIEIQPDIAVIVPDHVSVRL